MQEILANGVVFGGISLLVAGLAMALAGRPGPDDDAAADMAMGGATVFADAPRRYEFRQGYLVSPIDPDDAFLPDATATDRSVAFEVLARGIAMLHADLPARLRALSERGDPFSLTGAFDLDPLTISGRAAGDRVIVTIGPAVPGTGRQVVEDGVLAALHRDADDLRQTLDSTSSLMWTENDQRQVVWANAAYLARIGPAAAAGPLGPVPTWPVARVFHDQLDPAPEAGTHRRCRIVPVGQPPATPPDMTPDMTPDMGQWFEVSARISGNVTLFCATPIDRLVAAETALRDFVQTLSKTFAHLPIGLAIFDKRRELMMFNPALVALSTLPPAFLSGRPGLVAFLDALRDARRMPEPRNYRTWRDDIARLEQGAKDGTYQELWTLPTGQCFRVMGRPHPDGAMAFLFEDITAEMSLTRKFRGDLDLFRAALDTTPGALAVFSAEGRLMLVNRDYGALWGLDAGAVAGTHSVAEVTLAWQGRCAPSPVWGDIRAFAAHQRDRGAWTGEILVTGVGPVAVGVMALAGGAMAVRFEPRATGLVPDPPCLGSAALSVRGAAALSGPRAPGAD